MAYQNTQDRRGRTELHYATIKNDPTQVASLLNQGADPNYRDLSGRKGFTPLYYAACENRDLTTVTMLAKAGAKVDQQIVEEISRQTNMEPIDRTLREIRTILQIPPPTKLTVK